MTENEKDKLHNKIKKYALSLIARREYSSGKIRFKMTEKFSKNVVDDAEINDLIEETITELTEINLINDERFAQIYFEYLSNFQKYSLKQIRFKMRDIGRLPDEIISKILENMNFDGESEKIAELIKSKYKNKPREKYIASLYRAGFVHSDILKAEEILNN